MMKMGGVPSGAGWPAGERSNVQSPISRLRFWNPNSGGALAIGSVVVAGSTLMTVKI